MWWRSEEESHAPLTTPSNASATPRSARSHGASRIRTPVNLRFIGRHVRNIYRKTRIHRTRKRRAPFSRIPTRVKPFFRDTIQENSPGTAVTDVLFFLRTPNVRTGIHVPGFKTSAKPKQSSNRIRIVRAIKRDRLPSQTSIRITSHHPILRPNSPSKIAKASLTFIRRT